MKTGLLIDQDFCLHDPGDDHPEAPGRIRAIIKALEDAGLPESCHPIAGREVTDDEIRLAHTDDYLKTVLSEIDGTRAGMLSTGDTHFGPHSLRIARNAAGGLLSAVDGVISGELKNAFCAVRPPGHHATSDRGMGFCIFNNAASATRGKHMAWNEWPLWTGTSITETARRTFFTKTARPSTSPPTSTPGIPEPAPKMKLALEMDTTRRSTCLFQPEAEWKKSARPSEVLSPPK